MSALGRRDWIVLALFGVLCLFTFQGARTLTEHEVFAAEPAREMLAGEGWVLQPFAGEVRTKKPPGQSWLIAASVFVTRTESEVTARLPSALAGFGLAAVVAWIAARVGNRRTGLIAGLMTLTCVGVQQRARLAEADMALAFCVALANACLVPSPVYSRERVRVRAGGRDGRSADNAPSPGDTPSFGISTLAPPALTLTLSRDTGRGDRSRALIFWIAVAAGFLLKGPIVFGFTLLPALAAWVVLRWRAKRPDAATAVRRRAFWWPAIVLGLAVIVAWPVAAWREHPAVIAQWRHEILDRFAGKIGRTDAEREAVERSAVTQSATMTAGPVPTVDRLTDAGRRDSILSYAWLVPTGTMPWFPFAAVGLFWAWAGRAFRRPANVVLGCWFGCGVVVVTAIAFKVLHYVLPAIAPLIVLAAFGFDRLLTRWQRSRPKASRAAAGRRALVGWFGAAAIGWGVWNGVVLPRQDTGRAVKRFAADVNAIVPAGQTIYFYRVGEDRTSWYLHRSLRQTTDIPIARPAYLLLARGDLPEVRRAAATRVLAEADRYIARDPDEERRVLVRVD